MQYGHDLNGLEVVLIGDTLLLPVVIQAVAAVTQGVLQLEGGVR